MDTEIPESLFDGSDDERLIDELWDRIERKSFRLTRAHNDSQRAFFLAWEATIMLNGDGFEYLLEQRFSLEDYAESFVKIGMPQVKPIFDRVGALIPAKLRSPENQKALFAYLHGLFDELKDLLYEFFDASKDIVTNLSRYVREHWNDFAAYADG